MAAKLYTREMLEGQKSGMQTFYNFCIDPVFGSKTCPGPTVGGIVLGCFSINVFWWLTKRRAYVFCLILSKLVFDIFWNWRLGVVCRSQIASE